MDHFVKSCTNNCLLPDKTNTL